MREIHIYPGIEDVIIHIHKQDPSQLPLPHFIWPSNLDPNWYYVGDVPNPTYKITTTGGTMAYVGLN